MFPIAWVWMIDPRQRRRSARAITLFVGFALSPAAIFFALGFSYRMTGGLVMSIGDGFIQSLANLFVAFLALVVTTCTPFLLIKYMPVGLDGLVDQGQTWDPKGMNLPRHDSTSSGTAEESSQSFMEQADSGSLTSSESGSGGSSLMKRVQDKLNNGEGAAGKGPAGAGGKPGMGEAAGTAAETEGAAGAAGAAEAATAVAAPEVAAAAAAAEALHKTGEKAEQVGEKATDAATKTAEKTAGDTAHHAGAPVDPGSAQPGQKNPLSEAQEVRTDQAPTSGEADHPTAQQPEAPGSAGQVREESAKGATMAPEGAGSVEGLAGEQPSSNVAAGEPENAEGHAEAAGDGDPRDGLALAGATGATAAQDLTGTSGLDDGSEPTVPIPLDDGTYAAGGGLGDGAETAPDGGESAVLADDSTVDASWGEGLASGSYSDPTEPAGIDSGAAPAADLVADGGSGAGGLSGDPAVEQGTPVGGTADSGFADGNTSGESLATTSSSGASLTGETFTGASHGETTASSGLGQAPASDVQAGGISHGEAAGETLVGGGYGEGTAAGGHGGSPITGETMTSSGSVENSSYVEAPATGQSLTNDSYTDAPPTGGYSEGTGFAETTSGGQGGAPVTDGYDQGVATGETFEGAGYAQAPVTGESLASSGYGEATGVQVGGISYSEAPATGEALADGGYAEGTVTDSYGEAPAVADFNQGPGYTEAPATGETTTSGGHGGAPTTGETLASSSSVGGASGAAGQEYVERDPYTSGRSTGVSEEEMSSTAGESSQSAWGRLGALAAGAAAAGLTQSKAHGARAADHMTRPHGYEDRDPYRGRRS